MVLDDKLYNRVQICWLFLLISIPLDLAWVSDVFGSPQNRFNASLAPLLLISALLLSNHGRQQRIIANLRRTQELTLTSSSWPMPVFAAAILLLLAGIELLATIRLMSTFSLIVGGWCFLAAIITIHQVIKQRAARKSDKSDVKKIWQARVIFQHLLLVLLPAIATRLGCAIISMELAANDASALWVCANGALCSLLLALYHPKSTQLIAPCQRCCSMQPRALSDNTGCPKCQQIFIKSDRPRIALIAPENAQHADRLPATISRWEKKASALLRALRAQLKQRAIALLGAPA